MGATVRTNTSNMLVIDHDNSLLLLGENNFITGNMAASGADIVLVGGELVGRISATGKLKILASASTDGSEYPLGVVASPRTITDGTNADISICVKGMVAEEKVVFDGTDDMDTVVDDIQLRDRIAGDTLGIRLITTTELSALYN